jgi:hypothetical protein
MVCAFLISLGKEKSIEYLNATFHIQDRYKTLKRSISL